MSRLIWFVAAILASAVCWFASAEARGIWPLAWFAPAPVLAVALGSSAVVAAAVTFVAFFLGALGNWPVERTVLLPGVILVFHAARAVVFAVVALEVRRVVRAHRQWPAIFAFPVTATSVTFLVSIAWPLWRHGTAGSLAYSQVEFLPL